MRGMKRLRRWTNRIAPKAFILLYHRVAESTTDPQLLCVSPKHFAEHLDVLQRYYHSLSMRSLSRRLTSDLRLTRGIAITFDDGYADNFHNAHPLLKATGVPATVFVTAGKIDSNQEFWWDELERVLLSTPQLPDQLTLAINGQIYHWDFPENNIDNFCNGSWHVLKTCKPTPRQTAYMEMAKFLRSMEGDVREALLVKLFDWAGIERNGRTDNRALTSDELRVLARDGIVEISAHTMTHPVLSALSIESQRQEIVESKQELEKLLDQPVFGFSYPFGGRTDYTNDTVRIVKDAGFEYTCSNFSGHIYRKTDPYQLPRFVVRDWDGDEFKRQLEKWFAG